jgi:basic membrane protein A and related proteins
VRRVTQLAALLAVGSLIVTACSNTKTNSSDTPQKKTLKVGLAYDVGGRGDKSFNDSAAAGLDKVRNDLNLDVKELSATQGEKDADKAARLKLLADGKYNPIIAVGFVYAKALSEIAPKYPDTKFALIDSTDAKGANIANLAFAEEQGSFLVGVVAALKSKKKSVGFIGGVQVPLLQKFQAGFEAGVKAADPSVTVTTKYLTQPPDFSGFGDPAKGKATGEGIYDGGADVIFAAAGGSGTGVFQAAKAKGALAIGVDSDQYNTAPAELKDVIISSMLKRVDNAVFDFVKTVADNTFSAGPQVFNLAKDGVGYSTSGGAIDDVVAKVDEFKKQIIDGKITVPVTP